MAKDKQAEREALAAQFRNDALAYADKASRGLGVSKDAGDLHKLIDRITSNVYGMHFAYCGREHTVI